MKGRVGLGAAHLHNPRWGAIKKNKKRAHSNNTIDYEEIKKEEIKKEIKKLSFGFH